MTPGTDNQLIVILRLILDDDIYYLSTRDFTSTGETFHKSLGKSSINIIGSKWDISTGGGISSVRALEFTVDKFNPAGLRLNDIYPATSGLQLTGRHVMLGIVWEGITNINDVTWLYKFFIKDYSVNDNCNIYYCIEESEINNKNLPRYSVQKNIDDGVSYYTNAPLDFYNESIPIVYGKLPSTSFSNGSYPDDYTPSQCVPVGMTKLTFKLASHPIKTITTHPLLKYISGIDDYMRIRSVSAVAETDLSVIVNNQSGASISLLGNSNPYIRGLLYLHPNVLHENSNVIQDAENLIDKDPNTGVALEGGEWISLKFDSSSNEDISKIKFDVAYTDIVLRAGSVGASSGVNINLYRINKDTGEILQEVFSAGINVTTTQNYTKADGFFNWSNKIKDAYGRIMESLDNLVNEYEWRITNEDPLGSAVVIYNFSMKIDRFNAPSLTSFTLTGLSGQVLSGKTIATKQPNVSNMTADIEGRMFGDWITGRSSGYSSGDLIENTAYCIESVIRDEINTEKDLQVTATGSDVFGKYVEINELAHNSDGLFYGQAYLHNVTKDYVTLIEQEAPGYRLYIDLTKDVDVGDNVFISNIGYNSINTDTFDYIGNTINGVRDGWVFARSLFNQESSEDILSQMCFESHCRLFKSVDNGLGDAYFQYKLVTLDFGSTVATFSKPLWNEYKNLSWKLTPMENLYSDFKLNFNYDPQRNKYLESVSVNKTFSSDSALDAYKTKCQSVEQNYKVSNKYEKNLDYIYDRVTATKLLQKLVDWHTTRRIQAEYIGDIYNHIRYEEGDKVLIDHPQLIPTGKNNSAKFLIINAEPIFISNQWGVKFELEELP